jgi:hypothetical protein
MGQAMVLSHPVKGSVKRKDAKFTEPSGDMDADEFFLGRHLILALTV